MAGLPCPGTGGAAARGPPESPPPTRGCSSFRGRARQPPAPPRGRCGHCRSPGLPSTHAGLRAPGRHQSVSRGLSGSLDGGLSRAQGVTCTCTCAEGTTWHRKRALPRTAHPPIFFSVFFFAFRLCQQTVTKSWQKRAEPLAAGGLSPRETQRCVPAGCGWEITRRAGEAGDGAVSAVSLIRGFLRAAEFPGVLVFLQAQRGRCRNNFARCASGVCQRERRWCCPEMAEEELGRLQLAGYTLLRCPPRAAQGLIRQSY